LKIQQKVKGRAREQAREGEREREEEDAEEEEKEETKCARAGNGGDAPVMILSYLRRRRTDKR
jgi:hypothetical protein